MDTKTVSYSNGAVLTSPHRYPFDITSAVQLWVTDENAQNKGIIFKCPNTLEGSSTYQTKTFASFNRSAYQPSIKVTYTTTPNSYVQIKEESISVKTGTTASLTWGASGSVIWTSSNNSVATVNNNVDNSGIVIVTAKSVGTTTIKASLASDADIYDVCRVNVTEDSVAITKTSTTLSINSTETLACEATGAVSWASSNNRVATVEGGVVTAHACGRVTITATLNSNSEVKDSCTVTVTPSPQITKINGIYRIKNVATSQYLTVDKYGNLIMEPKNTDTMGKLSQWWYVQKEDDNYYTIESLSLKGITDDGMYQNILSATTAYCTISSNQSVEPIEKWDITAFQNGYLLTSGYHLEKKLTCNQMMITVDTDELSNALWQFEYEFMGTSFTFDGEYTTYYDTDTGPLIVNVIYDKKVRNCMSDEDFCSVENCWNNLGMNIQVNVIYIPDLEEPGITVPNAHVTAIVRLVDFGNLIPVAQTKCYANGELLPDANKNQTWDSTVEIHLNEAAYRSTGTTDEQRTRAFVHEVGHVLKLKHPHDVVAGYIPNSIMCQWDNLDSDNRKVLRPTGYDKAILMAKWGEKDE